LASQRGEDVAEGRERPAAAALELPILHVFRDTRLGVSNGVGTHVLPNPLNGGKEASSLIEGAELNVDHDVVGIIDGAKDLISE
jgi:hypothetical protein